MFGRKRNELQGRDAHLEVVRGTSEDLAAVVRTGQYPAPSMVNTPHNLDRDFAQNVEDVLRLTFTHPLDELAGVLRKLTYGEMMEFVRELSSLTGSTTETIVTANDLAELLHKWATKPRGPHVEQAAQD